MPRFEIPQWPQPQTLAMHGRFRMQPEDFVVHELCGWQASGAGEHLLLEVEKRGLTTTRVAELLARYCSVPLLDVSYCGLKDRHAVTRQWFSVRDPGGAVTAATVSAQLGEMALAADAARSGLRIVAGDRHDRKLRRGDHAGNHFRLRLLVDGAAEHAVGDAGGDAGPDVAEFEAAELDVAALQAHLASGVANYFGPQRFGREASNLARARKWVGGGRLPRRGPERGFMLSAARSLLFNEVLAARVRHDHRVTALAGDVCELEVPTAPLWGRGRSATSGPAAEIEAEALAPWRSWCEALEHAGLTQERRAMLCVPRNLEVAVEVVREGAVLTLAFELGAGMFATSLIAALGDFVDASTAGAARAEPPSTDAGSGEVAA